MRNGYVAQIFRKAIVDLLLFESRQHPLTCRRGNQFFLLNHFEQAAELPRGAVAKINSSVVNCFSKGMLHLCFGIFVEWKLQRFIARRICSCYPTR